MTKDTEGNAHPHQDKRTLNRRHLLGGAVIAAGAGVVAWRAFDGPGEGQLDGSDLESPKSSSDTPDTQDASPAEPSPAPPQIIGVVGEQGFDISLGAVRIFAPAGVAAPGTKIVVTLPSEPAPPEISSLATGVGQPVSILLGNEQQPEQPVSIVFDLRGTDLAANVSETTPLTVMSWSGTPDSIALTTGDWDAQNQTLTATTDHFTHFWAALVDIGKYIKETVEGFLGLKFPKPDCAFDQLTIGSTPYSIAHTGEDPIWPCLVDDNGRLAVELHSNSNMAWSVTSRPSTAGSISGGWKDLGPGLAAIYQGIFKILGEERAAVMPGGSVRLPFDPNEREIHVEIRQSPVLYAIATTLQAAISVLWALPAGRMADAVLESFSALDCITEEINAFYQEESSDIARSVVMTTLSCVSAMLTEQKGSRLNFAARTALAGIGMLSAAANALIGAIQGIYREWTGSSVATYTIATTVRETPIAATTGDIQGLRIDQPIVVKWRNDEVGLIYAPPAIIDGNLYVGTRSGLSALDAATGVKRWQYQPYGSESYSTPAVANGLVYVTGYRPIAGLYAIDASNGKEVWQHAQEADFIGAPAVANGLVLVGVWQQGYSAFDATTGALRWNVALEQGLATPAIADGAVVLDDSGGTLHALDISSGEERWRFAVGEDVSNPVISGGVVYVGSKTGRLHAIDATSGEQRWEFSTNGWISSAAAVAGNVVYVGSFDRSLYAIDTTTGRELWRFAIAQGVAGCVVADGVVYATGDALYAIDAAMGSEYWHYALDTFVTQPSLAVGGGAVYVVNHDSQLEAFSNLPGPMLVRETALRGAPSQSGVERGLVSVEDAAIYRGSQETRSETTWVEVTVGGVIGWIPLDAIDPSTPPPPEGDIEYVYVPT